MITEDKMDDIEKMILEEYKKEKNIICGCEEISFEHYRQFKLAEYKNKGIIK